MACNMSTNVTLVTFTLVYLLMALSQVNCGYNSTFKWLPSSWSTCVYKKPGTCCECYQTRDLTCIHASTNQIVPPFYCNKSDKPRPPSEQQCSPCQQNCVLTPWSEWSACSDTCSPGTRHRTRDVLLPPRGGGATCGPLVELKDCDDPSLPLCIFTELSPQYEWHTAEWSSCRKTTNDSTCGEGIRNRAVSCRKKDGSQVAHQFCQYYLHGAEPEAEELCRIPCDCTVTAWSEWGPCSRTCHRGASGGYHGYQARRREVVTEAEDGGATCPGLMDTKVCDRSLIPACPRYVWHESGWGTCVQREEDGTAPCGPGVQTRDVYCTLEGDMSYKPVADILCVQDIVRWDNDSSPWKPPERRACQVACPLDCVLGEWENWSSCTQSCGTGGVRIRTRPIVQEKTDGGVDCDQTGRYEEQPCDTTPCYWWHTGQWSACLMESLYNQQCGLASQMRSVYCLNALDEVTADDLCNAEGPKPITRQDCWVSCPGECRASEWSEWGECSATCGVRGGIQTRSRQIIDPGQSPIPCPLQNELEQTRVCNQIACKVHLWQAEGWSECVKRDNRSELCGTGSKSGVQTRGLICQMDPGYPVNASYCNNVPKPTTTQVCDAPCPQHCKLSPWGDWSKCNQECGADNLKAKFRIVLRWPKFGGKACTGEPNENGVILKKKSCNRKTTLCGSVSWHVSEWSVCQVKGHSSDSCGKGLQSRNVTCVRTRETAREVNNGLCYEEGIGTPPPATRVCHSPCAGDCLLSEWTDFTPCSQSCGHTPGMRTRSRAILNWDPTRSLASQCPHLLDISLVDNLPCNMRPCPAHHWVTSDWGSCISHGGSDSPKLTCGQGTQTRHVLCVQDDGAYVPDRRCDIVAAMPRRQQQCEVTCPTDCQVTAWSDWSNCSQLCGYGIQHRERKIVAEPGNGGRNCPHLQETNTCFQRDCQLLDWETGEWGDCVPNWGMHCGKGTQSRSVTCPAGVPLESACALRVTKPPTDMECYVPCAGDCVMSEWSRFSECDCSVRNAVRTRSRQIIKEALSSAMQCEEIMDVQLCNCPTYKLVIGGWTNCLVFTSASGNQECGHGVQKRPVNCVKDDGDIVHLSHCALGNLTLSRSCDIACAEDCAINDYTPWSDCSASCGGKAMKTRSAVITDVGNVLGRSCPGVDQLTQTQICNSVPCYNYTWIRGPWHGCHTMGVGECGVSRETRSVECYRSDGAVVQDLYCLMHGLLTQKYSITSLDDLTQREASDLDLDRERTCGVPCPGDCVLTEWSDYGPCIRNCSHGNPDGVQARSRAVIRPALGGAPCPWELIQTRSCPADDTICPIFAWETGRWNDRNKRRVQCVLNDEIVVHGGCILEEQPSRFRDCGDICGEFSECIEGKCSCEPGFSGDGLRCLPEFGCATDDHCFLNNTYCDLMNKECLCWDATLPGSDFLCTPYADAIDSPDPLEELNQLFIYILIGCLIALFLLGIVTVTCMVSHRKRNRRRRSEPVEANKLKKLDKTDTITKTDKKIDPVYMTRVSSEKSDKSLTRSLQNVPYGQPYHGNLTHASSENDTGKGDSESSTEGSPPMIPLRLGRPQDKYNLDLDDDLFSNPNNDVMARQPFLPLEYPPRRAGSTPRPDDPRGYNSNSTLPRNHSPGHPNAVQLRVPSSRGAPPASDSDTGSRLSTFRPDDSFTHSVPSTDSDLTTIWIPQNNLSEPPRRDNRFPTDNTDGPKFVPPVEPPYDRNLTRTPPDMYENVSSSAESSPELQRPPPPRSPRGPPPPIAPKPSAKVINDAMATTPASRPISRRHNTEPVPAQYRNGMVFGRGDTVAPEMSTLSPHRGISEDNEAPRDLKETRGKSDSNMSAQTQDLLQYCDELLADLQRVANS